MWAVCHPESVPLEGTCKGLQRLQSGSGWELICGVRHLISSMHVRLRSLRMARVLERPPKVWASAVCTTLHWLLCRLVRYKMCPADTWYQ